MFGMPRRDIAAEDIDISDMAQGTGSVHRGADQRPALAKATG
jgi:hypothetical protein